MLESVVGLPEVTDEFERVFELELQETGEAVALLDGQVGVVGELLGEKIQRVGGPGGGVVSGAGRLGKVV